MSVLIGGVKSLDAWQSIPVVERTKVKGFSPDEPIWYPQKIKVSSPCSATTAVRPDSSRAFSATTARLGRTGDHQLPNSTSKIFSLQTSAGYRVLISNANPGVGRRQLHLSISDDGLTYRQMARLDIPSPNRRRCSIRMRSSTTDIADHILAEQEIVGDFKVPFSEIEAVRKASASKAESRHATIAPANMLRSDAEPTHAGM